MRRAPPSLLLLAAVVTTYGWSIAEDRPGENSALREVGQVRALEVLLLARDSAATPIEDLEPADLRVELKGEPLPFSLSLAAEAPDPAIPVRDIRLTVQIGSEEKKISV